MRVARAHIVPLGIRNARIVLAARAQGCVLLCSNHLPIAGVGREVIREIPPTLLRRLSFQKWRLLFGIAECPGH